MKKLADLVVCPIKSHSNHTEPSYILLSLLEHNFPDYMQKLCMLIADDNHVFEGTPKKVSMRSVRAVHIFRDIEAEEKVEFVDLILEVDCASSDQETLSKIA